MQADEVAGLAANGLRPVPHNVVAVNDDAADAVADVVRSGWWSMGPVTRLLEQELAKCCNRAEAVFVASGTSALRLALSVLDVQPGDAVGVPVYSCVALANAVLSLGATPVPLDSNEEGIFVDPASLATSVKLRCVIAVNTFGFPCNVDALKQAGMPVIEDCAHGFWYGTLGQRGTLAVASLHATKFLGCGRGGVVWTDDARLAERLRDLREYDGKAASGKRLNDKPDDLNAALALTGLRRLSAAIRRREALAIRYQAAFAQLENGSQVRLPSACADRVWYRYAMRTANAADWVRWMGTRGVQCATPVSSWIGATQLDDYPMGAAGFHSIVSLPLYPTLSYEEQDRVINAVQAVARGEGKA